MITARKGIINPSDPGNTLSFGGQNIGDIVSLMNEYDKNMFQYLVDLNTILKRDMIDLDQYENVLNLLQKTNAEDEYDYLNSLLHPENCKAVKIPSPIPVPSCAFQLHNTVTLTTNASGNFCFLFNPFFLYDKNILNKYVFPTQTLVDVQQSAFNFCTSFFFNNSQQLDGFTPNVGGWTAINIGQGIPNVYNQYRLVSASLIVRYIGRMDITSGVIGGAIIYDESIYPGGLMNYNVGGEQAGNYTFNNRPPGLFKYTNFDLGMDSFYHQERNCIQGLRELYFPLDNTYEEYQKMFEASDLKQMDQRAVNSDGVTEGIPACSCIYDVVKKGFQQMVYVLGAPPNSSCFKVDIYCNFETLPNAEFLNYMPLSLSLKHVSPDLKKQAIAIVQQQPITDLSSRPQTYGKPGGIVSGLKRFFKNGIPKTVLDLASNYFPIKLASSLYNLYQNYTFNKNDSFQNENKTPMDVVQNANALGS